jgi:hypothetical protein
MTDFTPAQRGEVKIVKIRVIHDFYDKENDLKLRSVGDTLTVSKDRAEYLVRMKIAEVIDSKGGDPESPIEAQD